MHLYVELLAHVLTEEARTEAASVPNGVWLPVYLQGPKAKGNAKLPGAAVDDAIDPREFATGVA